MEHRQRLHEAGRQVLADDGTAVFVTMTLRHEKTHTLDEILHAVYAALNAVTSGGTWTRDQKRYGILHWARSVELPPPGKHGWHPHVHMLMFLDKSQRPDLGELFSRMADRWCRAVVRRGLPSPGQDQALQVEHIDTDPAEAIAAWASYLTKGFAAEALKSTSASTGWGHILQDAAVPQTRKVEGRWTSTTDPEAAETFRTYAAAVWGRHQYGASRSLSRLDVPETAPDAAPVEPAGEEADSDSRQPEPDAATVVAVIPAEAYRQIRHRVATLLRITERDGPVGAWGWLDAEGIAFRVPSPPDVSTTQPPRGVIRTASPCAPPHRADALPTVPRTRANDREVGQSCRVAESTGPLSGVCCDHPGITHSIASRAVDTVDPGVARWDGRNEAGCTRGAGAVRSCDR
jgi:hypothetical protein